MGINYLHYLNEKILLSLKSVDPCKRKSIFETRYEVYPWGIMVFYSHTKAICVTVYNLETKDGHAIDL